MSALAIFTQESGSEPLTMSSREIAELTGKRHDNVVRDIRTMLEALEKDVLSFEAIYKDAYGREQQQFLLPKDLTLTLVTGYDVKRRHAINVRWLELEAAAAQPTLPPVNLTRMQLIELVRDAEGERLVLENKVDQFKTSVASAIQTLQSILQTESGEVLPKGFPAYREAQASLASNPASPHRTPQPKLSTFEFEGHTIRAVTDATGETRYVGKDVCQALGFKQHSRVIHESCRGEVKYHHFRTGRGKQPHRLLSEADVFLLVDKRVSPLAGAFWNQLQDVFLPGLRGVCPDA